MGNPPNEDVSFIIIMHNSEAKPINFHLGQLANQNQAGIRQMTGVPDLLLAHLHPLESMYLEMMSRQNT